jgi:hypothetical protein
VKQGTLVRLGASAVLLLVVVAAQRILRDAPAAAPHSPTVGAPSSSVEAAPEIGYPAVGFRDAGHLVEHFQKHGAEFGEISEEEYLRRAQQLRDRPAGGEILESIRQDGVITRFDRSTGAFLAVDPDRTIRTFFRPNDGEAYFQRQLKRGNRTP